MTAKLAPQERLRRKKARDRAYYLKHYDTARKRLRTQAATWRKENPEKSAAIDKRYRYKLRDATLRAYGGKCACCGLDDLPFLSIDHIANDGAEHRRQVGIGGGTHLYRWLKARGYPKQGLQVLCYNCNLAKAHYGGVCPHKTRARESQVLAVG